MIRRYIRIDAIYAEHDDMTFIMKREYDFDTSLVTSEKVVGWYYGKPNEATTKAYEGKLEANYMEV